jgi:hypothetical protein
MFNQSEMVIYQSDDGRIRLETRLENETLWMTQSQMAEFVSNYTAKHQFAYSKHL